MNPIRLLLLLLLLISVCLPMPVSHAQTVSENWKMPPVEAQAWKIRISTICPPSGWTVTAHGNAIVIQRDKAVQFRSDADLINAPATGQTREESLREGTYRLTLRFAPRLSQQSFEKLSAENRATQKMDAELRQKYGVVGKFGIITSYTKEQKQREQDYREEAKKLVYHQLPDMYSADYSIYLYYSWNWLENVSSKDENVYNECKGVWQNVEKLFGQYDPNVARGGGTLGRTEPENVITYHSAFENVKIKGLQLTYSWQQYQYESAISGNPARVDNNTPFPLSSVRLTGSNTINITSEALDALLDSIESAGFYDLQDAYGAPIGDRFYPYQIDIEARGQHKRVVCRSNPQFPAPTAFDKVEKLLLGFQKTLNQKN